MFNRQVNWERELLLAIIGLMLGAAIGYEIVPPGAKVYINLGTGKLTIVKP